MHVERERLRNKLIDLGHRFVGFDKVIEEDTVKRRQQEVQKICDAQQTLFKLERAVNCEIRRRVDAGKLVQALTEQLANDMLQKLQVSILVRIAKLASSIESLSWRCCALERGIFQFRKELPAKLQNDSTMLVKEIGELRRHMDADRQRRIERDTALFRQLADKEKAEMAQFERGRSSMQNHIAHIQAEMLQLVRPDEDNSSAAKFRVFILEELSVMKNILAISRQAREQTDDEIVQAMSQYTNALQKGLHAANSNR